MTIEYPKNAVAADYDHSVPLDGRQMKNNETGKIETITESAYGYAYYDTPKRRVSVRTDRIFLDGRPRKRGYNLLGVV